MLINQHNKQFSSEQLKGKYSLVYFGFTHCPAICPTDLGVMNAAMYELEELSEQITPVMITIDPARDKPARLAEFFSNFHPSFIALTGAREDIAKAISGYKVYSRKIEVDGGEDTFDHSAFTYFMSPRGEYITHFPHDSEPEVLAQKIRAIINK